DQFPQPPLSVREINSEDARTQLGRVINEDSLSIARPAHQQVAGLGARNRSCGATGHRHPYEGTIGRRHDQRPIVHGDRPGECPVSLGADRMRIAPCHLLDVYAITAAGLTPGEYQPLSVMRPCSAKLVCHEVATREQLRLTSAD